MSTALKRATAMACGCSDDRDPPPRKRGKQSFAGLVAQREAALHAIINDQAQQIAALRAQVKHSVNLRRGR